MLTSIPVVSSYYGSHNDEAGGKKEECFNVTLAEKANFEAIGIDPVNGTSVTVNPFPLLLSFAVLRPSIPWLRPSRRVEKVLPLVLNAGKMTAQIQVLLLQLRRRRLRPPERAQEGWHHALALVCGYPLDAYTSLISTAGEQNQSLSENGRNIDTDQALSRCGRFESIKRARIYS